MKSSWPGVPFPVMGKRPRMHSHWDFAFSHSYTQDWQLCVHCSKEGLVGLTESRGRDENPRFTCPTSSLKELIKHKPWKECGRVRGRCLSGGNAHSKCKPPTNWTGMFSPCKKPPDSGKGNKKKREEALLLSNKAPPTSHVTNLQTNYLEPDIVKKISFIAKWIQIDLIQNRWLQT